MSIFGSIGNGLANVLKKANPLSWGDDSQSQIDQRNQLMGQGVAAGGFADAGQQGYGALGQQGMGALTGLQALANGQNSVSAEQLRQGLQQNLAAQQSMAAGASPRNAAMAARTAAINMSNLGAGLAGQQALAGLQERQQAMQQYAGLLQGLRGQDLQASLGGRQAAINAYGGYKPEGSFLDKYGQPIAAGIGAAVKSDRNAKTDIRDGSKEADQALQALKGLRAHFYRYKDERDGKGARLGIMAQDLEEAGLGHAVADTPTGKVVHGGHLATALAAMMPGLDKRLSKLEGKGG